MHSPRGIHSMYDGADWSYAVQDGLGSVRMEVGATASKIIVSNHRISMGCSFRCGMFSLFLWVCLYGSK
jgi:hypothetical protein